MKLTNCVLSVLSVAALTACGSTKTQTASGPAVPMTPVTAPVVGAAQPMAMTTPTQAISDQVAVSDFRRRGIKIIYSLTGNLEAIEVTGYAPIWGRSQMSVREAYRVAELEAKKSLNDFINQETILSDTAVSMMSRNLERARDLKVNDFPTNRPQDLIATVEDDLAPTASPGANTRQPINTGSRTDAFKIATEVHNNIQTRNQGILSGLFLKEGTVIDNGRTVQAVYRWDQKHNQIRTNVRHQMMQ